MVMPRNVYHKAKKEDIDDAILHSEYDEKRKKYELQDKLLNLIKQARDFILEIDPKLELYLECFRISQDLLKKIEGCSPCP